MSISDAATTINANTYTNICPDGHACDNDAACVESLIEEHKYVCDCAETFTQLRLVYSGLSCQHVATAYCTVSGELSQTTFCVNQGTCIRKGGPTDPHAGCICQSGYTGEHCQYITGSAPVESSYFLDGTTFAAAHLAPEGRGLSPAAIILPILFVVLGGLGFFLWRYRGYTLANGHLVDKSKQADSNMLDADGSNFNASLSQLGLIKGRRLSTPSFSSSHKAALMDPPDFDDLLEQSDHVAFHMDPTGSAVHKLFASDPTLHYNPTVSMSGSGSPTNQYGTDFEEYDPKDFHTQDATQSPPPLC